MRFSREYIHYLYYRQSIRYPIFCCQSVAMNLLYQVYKIKQLSLKEISQINWNQSNFIKQNTKN